MILVRLKGSVTPLRLTMASTASSTVVNRLPHSGHERRRRINWPSSASRESTTRESACRQYGQRTANLLQRSDHHAPGTPNRTPAEWAGLWITCGELGDPTPTCG